MTNLELSIEQRLSSERTVLSTEMPGPGRYVIPGGMIEIRIQDSEAVCARRRFGMTWDGKIYQYVAAVKRVIIDCSEAPNLQGSREKKIRHIELSPEGIGRTQISRDQFLVVQSR